MGPRHENPTRQAHIDAAKATEVSTCATCGDPALYVVKGRGFCRLHRSDVARVLAAETRAYEAKSNAIRRPRESAVKDRKGLGRSLARPRSVTG